MKLEQLGEGASVALSIILYLFVCFVIVGGFLRL